MEWIILAFACGIWVGVMFAPFKTCDCIRLLTSTEAPTAPFVYGRKVIVQGWQASPGNLGPLPRGGSSLGTQQPKASPTFTNKPKSTE